MNNIFHINMGVVVLIGKDRKSVAAGFRELHDADQYTILRFGQSQSRILVAAQHWYDPELDEFHNFYPWKPKSPRPDFKFRQDVLVYSRTMRSLDMDQIEASLLNALVLIAAGRWRFRLVGLRCNVVFLPSPRRGVRR